MKNLHNIRDSALIRYSIIYFSLFSCCILTDMEGNNMYLYNTFFFKAKAVQSTLNIQRKTLRPPNTDCFFVNLCQ